MVETVTARERANLYPVRLYKRHVLYIDYLSQSSGDTRGEVVRKIIDQHKARAEANGIGNELHAVSDDGKFEIVVRRRSCPQKP
jgi:hypothetical protein